MMNSLRSLAFLAPLLARRNEMKEGGEKSKATLYP